MRIPLLNVAPTHLVPCGHCTACCQGDAVFLHPELGDDPSMYITTRYEGRTILEHKANGDCIYLDRQSGCTIHSTRPAICRELDCRKLLASIGEAGMRKAGLEKVAEAAKHLIAEGKT